MAKITIPYTTFVNPQNIEVQRGQLFYVRVFGLGGSGNYSSIEYVDFLNRWTFTSNSNQIELVKREDLGTIESGAWFRAGNMPGDYTISITSRDSEEFGESFCYVRIVESAVTGDIEQISPSLYSVDFLDEDNPANINYSSNPQKFYWYEQKFGESHNSRISDPASKIGWRYPSNSVFSITSDNNYFYFHRGQYGVVLAQAYLKSNPYIYYPVRIMYNGGDVKYYIPSSSSNTIRAVELTKSTVVLERNSVVQIRANVIDTNGTDSAGVSWEEEDGRLTTIVAIRATSNPTSTVLSIMSYSRLGSTNVIIRSKTDPTKYAILRVAVVEDASKYDPEEDVPTPTPPVDTDYVNSVSIIEKTLTLKKGETYQLSAVVDGTVDTLSWVSGDISIASVSDNGTVIALSSGKAIISAVSTFDSTKTGSCVINVVDESSDEDEGDKPVSSGVDSIIRIDYNDGKFEVNKIYEGNLGFSTEHPIESITYYETEDIQKIYWVDGIHVLRFANFMAKDEERALWDDTYFDSNRLAEFDVKVSISKDNSGNVRANGVTQYFLTYYNKYGQETNYVWASDLVYLSPSGRGGAADETNQNKVTLTFSNLDTRFTNFRVYSIFRSSLDGQVISYLVAEGETSFSDVIVADDGAHLEVQDSTRLLFLGSQSVLADTMTHKDQVLFLGNLQSVGRDYENIENAIKSYLFDHRQLSDGKPYLSSCIRFIYSDKYNDDIHNIPYSGDVSGYGYENQLLYSSSEITTFKGGERYRFGLKFKLGDGTETDAFWIGDADNDKYPVIDESGINSSIRRVVAECTLPAGFVRVLKSDPLNIQTVQLLIAQATYADRSVKAQGIVNPTMFNVWERYSDRVYSFPSWIARPRGAGYAYGHFTPVHNSIFSHGEIECNYWPKEDVDPTPFYQYDFSDTSKLKYVQEYSGASSARAYKVLYSIEYGTYYPKYLRCCALILRVYSDTDVTPGAISADVMKKVAEAGQEEIEIYNESYRITACKTPIFEEKGVNAQILTQTVYSDLDTTIRKELGQTDVYEATFTVWVDSLRNETNFFKGTAMHVFSVRSSPTKYDSWDDCENVTRWELLEGSRKAGDFVPAYFQKHLMFIDENVVTLHSPEIQYEAVSVDSAQLKFRLVGAAKITSGRSDYTVDATHGYLSGENLVDANFSWSGTHGNSDGLISWPLWKEKGTSVIEDSQDKNIEDRTSADYTWGGTNYYWLHMWGKSGSITGYYPEENETNKENGEVGSYSILNRKVFANLRYSYETIYKPSFDFDVIKPVRQVDPLTDQFVQIEVGSDKEIYSPNPNLGLTCPGTFKYKILYSGSAAKPESSSESAENADLYTSAPVQIAYRSQAHAVISLPSEMFARTFTQTILPYVRDNEFLADNFPIGDVEGITPGIVPWRSNLKDEDVTWDDLQRYTYYYAINQEHYDIPEIGEDDKYLFIGELYQDKDENTLYGGISDTAIANCRFIVAGPQYALADLNSNTGITIYGNQGDTFFQRWDCLQTMPYSDGAVNNVIDVTSVMVETHINIDGRTDKQRDISELASIDTTTYGQLNRVYSQSNNYVTRRDLTEDQNVDSYQSSVTWTMEKADAASIDEWTHITLASTLKLDGDKGDCRALRRFQNSIISFQDRGIAEILFNSRTQISTQDGVPVEIANSGKVDGKRYITNKYGCTNKWSIVEGKNALYFIDSINKAFCGFGGNSIDPLSTRLGFSVWFKNVNDIEPWTPKHFNNIVSFYDRIYSDVYLVKKDDEDNTGCLVYNEPLGVFTSYFDYHGVPMMTNVEDRFVSFKDNKLWLQNEGAYCNLHGTQYDFWTQYRVTPEPYGDKVWTNVEYRADFYRVLQGEKDVVSNIESNFADDIDIYQKDETFDYMRFWNEYQTTDYEKDYKCKPVKKFRIWRLAIPRAIKTETNKYGLDRIRNPWLNLLFKKRYTQDVMASNQDLMQLHDITVIYYE